MMPVPWEVRANSEFRAEPDATLEDTAPLRVDFMLQVSDTGRAEDNFRFRLAGGDPISVEFSGRECLRDRHFRKYLFHMEVRPEEVDIRRNCFSMEWEDLAELVAEQVILVELPGSQEPAADFARDYAKAVADNPELSAACRWVISCDHEGLSLKFQLLPGKANQLNQDPRLAHDGCSGVALGSFHLDCLMESGALLEGPRPTLYAKRPERALESLKKDPTKLLPGLIHVLGRMSRLRQLQLEEAWALVKDPTGWDPVYPYSGLQMKQSQDQTGGGDNTSGSSNERNHSGTNLPVEKKYMSGLPPARYPLLRKIFLSFKSNAAVKSGYVYASLADKTWAGIESALRQYQSFKKSNESAVLWPWGENEKSDFAIWLKNEKELKRGHNFQLRKCS